jgi:hypothetical protein
MIIFLNCFSFKQYKIKNLLKKYYIKINYMTCKKKCADLVYGMSLMGIVVGILLLSGCIINKSDYINKTE